MKNTILSITLLVTALMFAACEPAASNSSNSAANAGNRPANNTAAAPAADTAAVETEIKKLANDSIAATLKGDVAAFEKLWADNYTFIGQDGAVATRAQRLESVKSGTTKISNLVYEEVNVRSNAEGNGALLVAKATVKGTSMGKPVDSQVRVSQVWSKTKDGWKQVSTHVTTIDPATAKADDAAKADDKKADANSNKSANK